MVDATGVGNIHQLALAHALTGASIISKHAFVEPFSQLDHTPRSRLRIH